MAKNRRTIITELFQAFAKNDDFNYTEDQLWNFFDRCVEDPNIPLKKLSKERETKTQDGTEKVNTRGKSGWQHFQSQFSGPIPEGMGKRAAQKQAWDELSPEEKEEWKQKATEVNEAAGIQKKPSPIKTSQEDIDKYEQQLMEWSSKDPETRGPIPSRPSSEKSSPASSPPASPKENSTENSNADEDSSDDETLEEKLAKLQLKNDSDSDSDSDSDNDSDDDDDNNDDDNANNERIEWLKLFWTEHSLKKNSVAHFKAWIMFTNTDIFGPNKDNNISNAQLNDFKAKHEYTSRSKDETAPWFQFIIKKSIM
jgi:hypothetical protein